MERQAFLNNLATRLNRPVNTTEKPVRNWQHRPVETYYTPMNQDQLLEALKAQCQNIHTDVVEATTETVGAALKEVVAKYGNGAVSLWDDPRYAEYGLSNLIQHEWPADGVNVYTWSGDKSREQNFAEANSARVGLAISEYCLTESGTVVLYSAAGAGKAVGLLPHAFVALIPKSSIVARMTQAAEKIQERVDSGEILPHAIDFVSGPSNSADIEMKLVVGVHGPVQATYIVLTDC